ncbi:MAG TPA: 2'-5' RNA ligase family protein [Chryseolinea sp.]|nr:2'-5' RNA ligase family protein [Chryseolinea sp.]
MKPLTVKINEEVRELFFVISPPPHIMSDVSVLKDDVQFLVGHELEDRYVKAHISLFKFDDKKHFDEIIQFVESKAFDFQPFNIFIKNLNFFHSGTTRSVYLDIVNKYLIQDIFEKVVKEDINYTPHISIARNLESEDFLKTWLYLKDFHYSQHFLCDRITVLARAGKRWTHYRDIMFAPAV